MLTFRKYITLSEASRKDIIFQHAKTNDYGEVKDVIDRAFSAKKQGAKIDMTLPFTHIKNAVEQHENKQKLKSDIGVVHHDDKTGVTIRRINNYESMRRGYNYSQGKLAKTNWCIAANSDEGKEMWDEYSHNSKNRMYAIHHQGKVYGVHESDDENEDGIKLGYSVVRDANDKEINVKDLHPDILDAMAKTKEMAETNVLVKNPRFKPDKEQLSKMYNNPDPGRRQVLARSSEHASHFYNDQDHFVRHQIASMPNHASKMLNDKSSVIRDRAKMTTAWERTVKK